MKSFFSIVLSRCHQLYESKHSIADYIYIKPFAYTNEKDFTQQKGRHL